MYKQKILRGIIVSIFISASLFADFCHADGAHNIDSVPFALGSSLDSDGVVASDNFGLLVVGALGLVGAAVVAFLVRNNEHKHKHEYGYEYEYEGYLDLQKPVIMSSSAGNLLSIGGEKITGRIVVKNLGFPVERFDIKNSTPKSPNI